MSFTVAMMPAAASFLECAGCGRRHFSLLEDGPQVRREASTLKGWACNESADEDFCSNCKEG
jgi:hypothetical protein